MMKIYIILCAIVYSNVLFSQTKIRGVVKDKYNDLLKLATVKIEGKGIGTVTDEFGYFCLSIPDSLKDCELKVSHINYKSQNHYINKINDSINYYFLEPIDQNLNEVVIISPKMKSKWLNGGGLYLGKTHVNVLGSETANMFNIKGSAMIRQLRFKIKACSFDSIPVKIYLYKYDDKNDELGDVLFSENLVVGNIPEESKEDKVFDINIEEGIKVENEKIFFCISYPFVPEQGIFEIPAYLGTGYKKRKGETRFEKIKYNQGLSMYLTYLK